MSTDDTGLREFMTAYEAEFGESISLKEAREMASGLLTLYDLLSKPLPEDKQRSPPVL